MSRRITIIVAALVAAVVGLTITLGLVIASDDDDGGGQMSGAMDMTSDDAGNAAGMMQAMGAMDSDAMLEHMREVLGEDGYQRMLAHLNDHRTNGGAMTGDAAMDETMHSMMDGMMQHMPAGANELVPPGTDEHHETPVGG